MTHFVGRIFRFGLVGGLATIASYIAFVVTMAVGLNYFVAGLAGWVVGTPISFVLNKRFTFAVRTDCAPRELALFVAGYVLQMMFGLAGYAVLISGLKFGATPAFIVNLVLTSTVSFVFMQFATFRQTSFKPSERVSPLQTSEA